MTMGAAQLMDKYGITCNVIMPRARTDMTNAGMTAELFAEPEEGFDAFNPVNVAPLVGYLASPEAGKISGEVMVVWGNQVDVIERPKFGARFVNPEGAKKWAVDGLHNALSEHYNDDYVPVWGGFTVPPQ